MLEVFLLTTFKGDVIVIHGVTLINHILINKTSL